MLSTFRQECDSYIQENYITDLGMDNPYSSLPNYCFWRRSVSGLTSYEIDPVTHVPFKIGYGDRIATAGSCFAQHIARTFQRLGYRYLVAEHAPNTEGAKNENFGVYSARFGNVYTTRQLLQLFERAYGLFSPIDSVWKTADGFYVDPFRPQIQVGGFSSARAVETDTGSHLSAVRTMMETADVFVFTLGLTETWISAEDGSAFPSAPGVVRVEGNSSNYKFHNLSVAEMYEELLRFIDGARVVNPALKFVLTVSPIPLIATYEDRHVTISNELSKSALRVVADMISQARKNIAYFPSYEIITSHFNGGVFFEKDMRSVNETGVTHVMTLFEKHFLVEGHATDPTITNETKPAVRTIDRHAQFEGVICDEEILDR